MTKDTATKSSNWKAGFGAIAWRYASRHPNGLTKVELEKVFYTSTPYAGFPAANAAKGAMLEV